MPMWKFITGIVIVALLAVGAYFYFVSNNASVTPPPDTTPISDTTASTTPQMATSTVIGKSVDGRDIVAYHYGSGSKEILFVGGIHGGYSWNTSLVAYQLMNYLDSNPSTIPASLRVTVIPDLNPDGLSKVVSASGPFAASDVSTSQTLQVAGRFNADTVDLNRNFDCDWQQNAVWQNKPVSGGTAAFSEPESKALRDYVQSNPPAAVVAFYASAGGVYASNCHSGVLPTTTTLMNIYAQASGYPAHENFDYYATTGDMTNWLAKENIPAFSVLLTNHTDTEWSKNQAGVVALLQHFAQ